MLEGSQDFIEAYKNGFLGVIVVDSPEKKGNAVKKPIF